MEVPYADTNDQNKFADFVKEQEGKKKTAQELFEEFLDKVYSRKSNQVA